MYTHNKHTTKKLAKLISSLIEHTLHVFPLSRHDAEFLFTFGLFARSLYSYSDRYRTGGGFWLRLYPLYPPL